MRLRSIPLGRATVASGVVVIVAAILVLTGCGGNADPEGASDGVTPVASPAETATPIDSPTPSESPGDGPTPGGGEQSVTLGRDQDYRVTTDGSTVTIICDGGGEIYVLADDATVTITGRGQDLEVRGSGNTVRARQVTAVEVHGSGNDVRVDRATEAEAYGDRNTMRVDALRAMDVYGNRNSARLGAVREIDITGDDNTIAWSSGNPTIDDVGTGNRVIRQ